MKQDTNIGTNILRVSASDEDADNNGAIRYSLAAPFQRDDLKYFDIQPESGWIYLKRPLDVSIVFLVLCVENIVVWFSSVCFCKLRFFFTRGAKLFFYIFPG